MLRRPCLNDVLEDRRDNVDTPHSCPPFTSPCMNPCKLPSPRFPAPTAEPGRRTAPPPAAGRIRFAPWSNPPTGPQLARENSPGWVHRLRLSFPGLPCQAPHPWATVAARRVCEFLGIPALHGSSQEACRRLFSWVAHAYTTYMLVLVAAFPRRSVEMIRYQQIIGTAVTKFKGLAWLAYDEKFRRRVAKFLWGRWSSYRYQIYSRTLESVVLSAAPCMVRTSGVSLFLQSSPKRTGAAVACTLFTGQEPSQQNQIWVILAMGWSPSRFNWATNIRSNLIQ